MEFTAKGFGGFSAIAFDMMLPQIAELFPGPLARDVMGYHLRMKHLNDVLRNPSAYGGQTLDAPSVTQMHHRRDELIPRLKAFGEQNEIKLAFFKRTEPGGGLNELVE